MGIVSTAGDVEDQVEVGGLVKEPEPALGATAKWQLT